MPLRSALLARLQPTYTNSGNFPGQFQPLLEYAVELTDGVAAGNADRLYLAERTVLTAANDDIDLAGVLTDIFGATITFARIKALMLINAPKSGAANTTNLTVGGGTNPFLGFFGGTTPTLGPIRPGGCAFLACEALAGLGTVTAGTADILRIANSAGASSTYQIGIVGTSS